MKIVINRNLWGFFLMSGGLFNQIFQGFFSFGILDIISFKLDLFVTTKERAFNT